MSLVEPQQPTEERQLAPPLTLNLQPSTNNPFRKGPLSPALSPPLVQTPSDRPLSRNPFLDQFPAIPTMNGNTSPKKSMSPVRAEKGHETRDLLNNLSIYDRPTVAGMRQPRPQTKPTDKSAPTENVPPTPNARVNHRPTQSQEAERRADNRIKPRGSNAGLDIFADPSEAKKPSERRPRRNSDSSVTGKPLDPEEEKKRRERRHREREHRNRDSKGRPLPSSSSRSRKSPGHRLDIIDKLDVTSIFGTGLFHHDGPFDACNPHRNRKGASRAPMQAFPKDSANSTIGGSGPVNKTLNLTQFHGLGAEGFSDYSTSGTVKSPTTTATYEPYIGTGIPAQGNARAGVDRSGAFNAASTVDKVHGSETIGLGTSTFLEGAPAARAAIQRRESEGDTFGLARKKSLAQKIRGISNSRTTAPRGTIGMAVASPDGEAATSPDGVQSAGGLPKISESNPFFNEYENEYEKKGALIKAAEERKSAEGITKIDRRKLERSVTESSVPGVVPGPMSPILSGENDGKPAGGFMNRVKSLRGGGRGKARPERKE